MTNPWLQIPASDYEGHMNSPSVAQFSFLAETFKASLKNYDSSTVALLGCATGNGLESINHETTHRVTVVDINPDYLHILHERYADTIPGLEIVHDDLGHCHLEEGAYSLIFAGLIFEYLDPQALLQKIARWLSNDGIFIGVLQLPNDGSRVTETPYTSLQSLSAIMNLVDPAQFKAFAHKAGLTVLDERVDTLTTGKSFYLGTYQKMNAQQDAALELRPVARPKIQQALPL